MPPRPKDKLCKKSPKNRSWRVSLLRRFAGAALIGCIIAPAISLANDTEAELGIGGLVLRKNAHVEMRSEDLYVSAKEIRVRYRFYNKSGSDVRTIVAFPLPPGGLEEHEFSTIVNGAPVNTEIEQRATVDGRDRTDFLKRYGVSLDGSRSQLDKLPNDTWDKLTSAGVAYSAQHYFEGNPTEKQRTALWTVQTIYYWNQTFPARAEMTIEHRYRPIVGGYGGGMDWNKTWSDMRPGDELFSDYRKKYCIDRDFVRSAMEKARHQTWGEKWISYILTTGGNWAGPIGEFRLVVDKGDPSNLVSFCADGVRKISPTEFEVRKKNFKPSKDLNVLILTTVQEAD